VSGLEGAVSRTPQVSIGEVFLRAAGRLPGGADYRSRVVAESLEYLQEGFDAHHDSLEVGDEEVLLGDNSYALAIETIAKLDEPAFVGVASRIIRDGAGHVVEDGMVSIEAWVPHLAGLLGIIFGEDRASSEIRIREALS
jgi:hypothetical protein